jgi:hypothetical protein
MLLAVVYVSAALVVAPSIFVWAEWIHKDPLPQPERRWLYSLLAGLLWPLLVVGLVQFALIATIRTWVRAHAPLAATIPGGSDVEAEGARSSPTPRRAVPYAQV